MTFVAEETRQIMASLGFRTIDEMVGENGNPGNDDAIETWKERGIDLTAILHNLKRKPGKTTSVLPTTK